MTLQLREKPKFSQPPLPLYEPDEERNNSPQVIKETKTGIPNPHLLRVGQVVYIPLEMTKPKDTNIQQDIALQLARVG